ncbi:hypothetical protein [Amycolatopsis taiwanensis]|uniref:Uncharacterized protein n=1 Tax=Amycolatopsis taiwanensis TaxID=342230 RepID=A0A9W6RBJ1_9PSEU|nr:hypothetical protein [Amycolatopsis taiwanensis]GLY71072.1 hypothetical protein Atai01_76910 [Amycolatopsis taiwanensis]
MTPHEAEIRKLARLLGAPPERFGYLRKVPPAELRRFREQTSAALFDAHAGPLRRMAAASRLLPGPVLARMAELAFGPLLSARIAGLVDPAQGVEIARRLSPAFLADVAAELDPRRASGIVAGLPKPLMTAVAAELARREDWVTVARFVDHLPESAIEAGLQFVPDSALAEIIALLDDPERVTRLLPPLPRDHLAG